MSRSMLDRRQLLRTGAALGALALGSQARAQGTARRGGVLRISVDQAVAKLNPLLTRVNPEYLVAELLYSGLTRLGTDMTPSRISPSRGLPLPTLPNGPSSCAEPSLPRRHALHRRRRRRDVRGDPRPQDRLAGAPECRPDRRRDGERSATVVFKLRAPYADLPVTLAYTNAKIIPAAIARGELTRLDREAIGTGPFKLVSFEPDRLIVVERNDRYYDPARPYLDRVEVVVYPDPTAEGSALISGDTDLMLYSAADRVRPSVRRRKGVKALRTPSGQFCNVNFGCDTTPFNDLRVRQALALCGRPQRRWSISSPRASARRATTRRSTRPIAIFGEQPQRSPTSPARASCWPRPVTPTVSKATLIASDRPGCTDAARRRDARDGEARRLQHQRPDHAARDLSRPGLEEGQLLCRLLQHAADRRRDLLAALHLERRLERDALEQRRLRQAGRRGARHHRRSQAPRALRRRRRS